MRLLSFLTLSSLFFATPAWAQEVPPMNNDPRVTKPLDSDMFDFISKTLGAGKLAPHLKCSIRTRNTRELRKFTTGQEWMEILEIDYNSNGFESGEKMKFKIPMNARYGIRKSTNQ